jgi:hypothetical protein
MVFSAPLARRACRLLGFRRAWPEPANRRIPLRPLSRPRPQAWTGDAHDPFHPVEFETIDRQDAAEFDALLHFDDTKHAGDEKARPAGAREDEICGRLVGAIDFIDTEIGRVAYRLR